MITIHPEVDAFWLRQGYILGIRNVVNQGVWTVWKDLHGVVIGLLKDNGLIQYVYNGGLYYEAEMLRRIKLSAFG